MEEYLYDIPYNVVLFAYNVSSPEVALFRRVAELYKGEGKDKKRNEVIFSFLAEDNQAVTYRRFNIEEVSAVFFYKSQKRVMRGPL